VRSKMNSLVAFIVVATAGLIIASGTLSAVEPWPTRTVKFIVTLGAGSGSDIGARLLADRLSPRWGQPVIVENRPGGDALVAINAFVGAHDKHVLLYAPSGSFTSHPYLHDNLPYKPDDLLPITRVSNTVIVVAVPMELHIETLAQLAQAARQKPGALNWVGVTGTNDFIFEGWLKREGLTMTKVPYRNPVDGAKDLGENRVQVYLTALTIVRPQIDAGKVKVLAVTNSVRAPTEPALPTAKEAGYPGLQLDGLVGLFGPSGMSLELRQKITADIRAVADSDPTIKERLNQTGQIPNIGGPEEFAKSIDEQRSTIAAVASELGLKPLP